MKLVKVFGKKVPTRLPPTTPACPPSLPVVVEGAEVAIRRVEVSKAQSFGHRSEGQDRLAHLSVRELVSTRGAVLLQLLVDKLREGHRNVDVIVIDEGTTPKWSQSEVPG